MAAVAYVFACLLVLQSVHSYILLTANLEDVQALAQQLSESPVVDQIQKIWRRASNQFNERVAKNKLHLRVNADEEKDEIVSAEDDGQVTERRRSDSAKGPGPARKPAKKATSSVKVPAAGGKARRRGSDSGRAAVDDLVSLGKLAGAHLKSMKEIFESV